MRCIYTSTPKTGEFSVVYCLNCFKRLTIAFPITNHEARRERVTNHQVFEYFVQHPDSTQHLDFTGLLSWQAGHASSTKKFSFRHFVWSLSTALCQLQLDFDRRWKMAAVGLIVR